MRDTEKMKNSFESIRFFFFSRFANRKGFRLESSAPLRVSVDPQNVSSGSGPLISKHIVSTLDIAKGLDSSQYKSFF